ncbi:MAG: glycosyltransferase [Pseudoclavibacter sp.]
MIPADTFPPNVNGAAKFTENLAVGMTRRGHDVHVVAPAASRRHGRLTETYDGERVTVHRVRSYRWFKHDWLRFVLPWRARAHARRILDEVQPDVVHFQSAVVLGRAFSIEAAKRGLRVIATNHLMVENLIEHSGLPAFVRPAASRIWWRDASATLRRAAAVTTPTRRAAEFLESNGGLRDVLAISCGLRTSDYTANFGEKTGNRILFLGRITGEKHIDVLLEAFRRLPSDLDAHLDIVGGGDLFHALQRLAVKLGVAERVTFHGLATDAELRRMLTSATVFAMPSTAELQSIATMEAMASGLPVVAANAMALPHLVHHGETGLLFEPGDAADLAVRLEWVLRAPTEMRNKLGREGLRQVQAHDIDRTFDLFERIYAGESVADVAADSVNEQDHSLDGAPRTGTITLPDSDDLRAASASHEERDE